MPFFLANFSVFSGLFYCLASLTAAESSGRQVVMRIPHTNLSRGQDQVLPEAGLSVDVLFPVLGNCPALERKMGI